MITKQPTILLTTLLLTTACQTPNNPKLNVDHTSLLRSMVYTQRHLLSIELNPAPTKQPDRHELLLKSHCDLIARNFVHVENTPQACTSHPINTQQKYCIAEFHRCISQCLTPKQQCQLCEQIATQCFALTDMPKDSM